MAWSLHVSLVMLMVPPVAMEIELCNFTITDIAMDSLFSINEEPIKTVFKYVVINTPDALECNFNTTEFWNSFGPTDRPLIGKASLECSTPTRVRMLPHEGKRHDNIIAHIQIGQTGEYLSSCNSTLRDVNNLAGGADLRELTMVNQWANSRAFTIVDQSIEWRDFPMINQRRTNRHEFSIFTHLKNLDQTENACSNLVNLGSLAIVDSGITTGRLLEVFSCSNVYTHMAEIRLKNINASWILDDNKHFAGTRLERWVAFWDKIQELFPNLQSLSLPNNNLDRYPDTFPWTNRRYQLPRNLSRTKYTDDQYVRPYYLQILPHDYKRVYNLENNKIGNLRSVGLHGCLDMITMINAEISTIDEQVFEYVSCLQSLRLGYNHIKDLPLKLFRNMTHLRELDLSHNLIKSLNATIFDDLVELEMLNLAHNSLESLPPELFVKLLRLRYIHLESNMLRSLDSQSFPTNSLAFEKLFVDGNYITAVPEFVFTTTGLVHISLAHNDITYILPHSTDGIMHLRKQKSMAFSDNDLDEGTQMLTTIDLSNNKIESVNSTNQTHAIWKFILQHFHLIVTDNPFNCDCNINDIVNLMTELQTTDKLPEKDNRFFDWKCKTPPEQQGRALINITSNETYCLAPDLDGCPPECKCYRRSNHQTTIVDCRSSHLKGKIHDQMPEGKLELWYSDNCISEIPTYYPESYMDRVIVLNVSNNKVKLLSEELIDLAQKLETLDLRYNHLTNLPESISNLRNLKWVSLTYNDLKCDCHSKPMKKWVMEHEDIIQYRDRLICISGEETKLLMETTDEDFQCVIESTDYKPLYLGAAALIIAVIVVIFFLFRLECKVLLYMYFGLHPFDRKEEIMNEVIDCVIVHSHTDTEWVMENIVKHLESQVYRFVVFDSERDFMLGYSIHENLTNVVHHSKRIVICLSADWNPSNVEFKLIWNSAVKKIKETRSNYGIVICKDVSKKTVKDKSLCKYIKTDRFINSTDRLFIPKLVYGMPRRRRPNKGRQLDAGDTPEHTYPIIHQQIYPTLFEKLTEESAGERQVHEYDVFISNSRDNDEFAFCTLRPMLETRGYKLCIPERDFLAGPTKEESILTAICRSRRTLLILSRIHWNDEWSLFTYKKAYERSLQEKNNHLMVLITDDGIDIEDEEIKCYLNGHVTLNVNDAFFYNKLLSGLPILHNGRSVSITMDIEEGGLDNECYSQDGGLLDNDALSDTLIDG